MKKNPLLKFPFLLLGMVILSGCMGQDTSVEKATQSPPTQPPPRSTQALATQPPATTVTSPTPPSIRTFTIEEVAKHNSRNDCWFIINDNVYDITPFISSHPGGSIITMGCGKDATILFETRPMGSGTAHSQRERDLLAKYLIGILVKIW